MKGEINEFPRSCLPLIHRRKCRDDVCYERIEETGQAKRRVKNDCRNLKEVSLTVFISNV